MSVHIHFLSHIPLLRELPEATRERLAACMLRRELPRRAVAQEKGVREQAMGFVLTGRLQAVDFTLDGREAGLYFLGPGEYYGELGVLDGGAAAEYVIATCPSQVLELPAAQARALLLPLPEVVTALARQLAGRVRAHLAQRTLLALANPQQRLAALLVSLTRSNACIDHMPTHQELAIMINTTRETVTRCLQQMAGQEIVRRDADRLLVLKPEALTALARGEASG